MICSRWRNYWRQHYQLPLWTLSSDTLQNKENGQHLKLKEIITGSLYYCSLKVLSGSWSPCDYDDMMATWASHSFFHVTSNSCSWRCWAGPCPSAACPCCSQHWGPHPDSLTSFHKSCPLTSQTQPEKCNIVDISHRVKSFMIRNEWFREKYYRNSSELEIEPPIRLTSLIDDFNPNDQQQFSELSRFIYFLP